MQNLVTLYTSSKIIIDDTLIKNRIDMRYRDEAVCL